MVIFFSYLWINHAWLSDDSMITMRTVVNFVNGQGMTWNPGERVQVFTHPLWFFVLSGAYLFTGSLYYSNLALSYILTITSLLLAIRCSNTYFAFFLCFSLLLSQAFMDYSSSGLENSLGYFLMVLFACYYFQKKYSYFFFIVAALLFLTRMDFSLIILPMTIYVFYKCQYRIDYVAPSIAIVSGWLLFSTFYFGYPLPNSFLAKMNTDFSYIEFFSRFYGYVLHTAKNDMITIAMIVAGCSLVFCRNLQFRCAGSGTILYMFYLSTIGGDFMAGRFFAVPAFFSVICLIFYFNQSYANMNQLLSTVFAWCSSKYTRMMISRKPEILIFAIFMAAIVYNYSSLPIHNNRHYHNQHIGPDLIADERGVYFQRYGLMAPMRKYPEISDGYSGILISFGVGAHGIENMNAYIVDLWAIGSPYLSRLLPVHVDNWRVGHLPRDMPINFLNFLSYNGFNANDKIYDYFRDIRFIVEGPLFSYNRIVSIFIVNLTRKCAIENMVYENIINFETMIKSKNDFPFPSIELEEIPVVQEGADWKTGHIIENGVLIFLNENSISDCLTFFLDHNDVYYVILLSENSKEKEFYALDKRTDSPGLRKRELRRGLDRSLASFDQIVIIPGVGDGLYSVSNIKLSCNE